MILLDRTTGDKFELKISDGEYYWETTESVADAEPIVEDGLNAGTYWKLFIDNGEFGWENTATVQDDAITIDDETTTAIWSAGIYDGQFRYVQTGVSGNIHGHSLSISEFLTQTLENASFLNQTLEVGI